jgi:hypothetical protein
MKSSAEAIAEYRVEKSRDIDMAEIIVVCEQCFRVTVKHVPADYAKVHKFVKCASCGKWVKNN